MTRNLKRLWDREWTGFRHEAESIYGKSPEEAADEILRMLGNPVLDGLRVLDVGCGLGYASRVIAGRMRCRLIVTDISSAFRAIGLAGFQGDAGELAIRSGSFDVAYAHGVFHYVPDPERAVKELARVTRPGGLVAFSLWPPLSPPMRLLSEGIRFCLRPIPEGVIAASARVLAPCHGIIHRLSGLRHHSVRLSESAHIIFNLLTAPHLNHADRETVERWLREAGCEVLEFGRPEVRVVARKRL